MLALVTVVLLGAVLPLGLLTVSHDRSSFLDATADQSETLAHVVSDRVGLSPTPEQARRALLPLVQPGYGLALLSGGRIVASAGARVRTPASLAEVAEGAGPRTGFTSAAGHGYALATIRLVPRQSSSPVLVLARPTTPLDDRARRLWIAFAAVALACVAGSLGLAFALSRWVARPLARLEETSHSFGAGALAARAELSGPAEVRRLAAAFNAMAERIDIMIVSQRRVVADVAHQLRTPLAALRLRLDLLAAHRAAPGSLPSDEARSEPDLRAVGDEVQRLSRLVDGLLAVARAEGTRVEPTRVEVRAELRERVEMWSPFAAEHEIELELVPGPVATAWIARDHLDQIMDNLLANCFDLEPPPAHVRISLATERDAVVVSVVDDGPGMPAEMRARAFDRFETGREDRGGTGLGLAIVSALLVSSGGGIELVETPGGGLTARIRLLPG
jgi:signal transduction histidine kinase